MFLKHFAGYVITFLGLCGIGLSVLAACGAVMAEGGLLIPGIIFIVSILAVFAGWSLRASA